MKVAYFSWALFAALLDSSVLASSVTDNLPPGYAFESVRFEYDAEACGGEITSALDKGSGDCVIDLNDFYVRNNEKRSCDVTIYVDLPPGLSMTTSRLIVEGDFQLDTGGSTSVSANFYLEGGDSEITLWRRWTNRDAGLVSDTFLEQEFWSGSGRHFSPCGGVAVFHGNFSINSNSQSGHKLSIIDIGRTDLGIGSNSRKPSAYWGWDYKVCD